MIKTAHPSQENIVSSKIPNQDFKDMDVLCTFKIKIEIQNSDQRCIKDEWPYENQIQDAKPQIETIRTWMSFAPSKSRQRAKIWIMGISKLFTPSNQDSSLHVRIKLDSNWFRTVVYQRPVLMILKHERIQGFFKQNKYDSNSISLAHPISAKPVLTNFR